MTTITQENVKFNSVLSNAAVLSNTAGVKTLILTDNLSTHSRSVLDTFITEFGGVNPIVSDGSGVLTVKFNGSIVGTSPTGLSAIAAATAGIATINVGGAQTLTSSTGLANKVRAYSAQFVVDGSITKSVKVVGSATQTYTTLLAALNAALIGAAVATLVGGNIVVTSATVGSTSSVSVYDTGLIAGLTGHAGVVAVAGVAPTTYSSNLVIDGVPLLVSVVGAAAQTFTSLVAALNTALGSTAVATLVGSTITITSASTGVTSSVDVVKGGTLMSSVAGFDRFNLPTPGSHDLVALMKARKVGGATLYDTFHIVVVPATPRKPAVPAVIPKLPQYMYFDGTKWRFLADDTLVNA